MDRAFDIILWGATGFTGQLIAEHLCRNYGEGGALKWAIAGRNQDKLETLRESLSQIHSGMAGLPILLGNADDAASLQALAAQARVVCSTVGPYAKYGSALVAACVEEGTHYCDLTGEPQWIRKMIDAHHEGAQAKGARIVHCCGFDSIPSDLGTWLVQDAAKERFGQPMQEVKAFFGPTKGGFSGGTAASLLNVMEEASDPAVRRVLGNPYGLNPEGQRKGPDGSDAMWGGFDEDLGAWTAPFLMAPINTKVVRRSNALQGYAYGEDFKYSEVMRTGKGAKGMIATQAISAGMGLFTALAAIGPTRKLLADKVLPGAGEGPNAEEREAGFFVTRLIGKGTGAEGQALRIDVKVEAQQDPGYGATAKMLGEAAVCLALDGDKLPEAAGVLTPASAMGGVLIGRLRAVGMTFEVLDV